MGVSKTVSNTISFQDENTPEISSINATSDDDQSQAEGTLSVDSDDDASKRINMIPISNFSPSKDNIVYNGRSIIAGLKTDESLVFQGQYSLRVEKGSISIYGATLHVGPKQYNVFASAATPLPRISAIPTKRKYLSECLLPEDVDLSPQDFDTIISLTSLSTGLEIIPSKFPKFRDLWGSMPSTAKSQRSFHPVYLANSKVKPLVLNDDWTSIASEIVSDFKSSLETPIVFVSGPKNSGKSTFCRFLLNYCLSALTPGSIHYMECDPGQTEYTPPGVVSLSKPTCYNFSSPFAHPNFTDVVKAHGLGYTSPKDVPLLYSAIFEDLLDIYKSSQLSSKTILIVNMPGWAKGYGLELLSEMMSKSDPTHSIYIGSKDTETLEDYSHRLDKISSTHSISTNRYFLDSFAQSVDIPHHSSKMFSAADLRNLQLSTYLCYNEQTHEFEIEKLPNLKFYQIPFSIQKPMSFSDKNDYDENLQIEGPQEFASPNSVLSLCYKNKRSDVSKIKATLDIPESAKIAAFGIMHSENLNLNDIFMCLTNVIISIVVIKQSKYLQISNSLIEVLPDSNSPNESALPISIIPPSLIPSVIQPEHTRCMGLGLLQKIDDRHGNVELITSINPDMVNELEKNGERIILIRGRIPYTF